MAGLDFSRTHMVDLLCPSTDSFDKHLSQVDQILQHLRKAGHKVNSETSTACAVEIEYLGYWITRDGTSHSLRR